MVNLEMEAEPILKNFKDKSRLTVLANSALCATVWHIWRERNGRIFQHVARNKIMVFRSIYEDISGIMMGANGNQSLM